MGGKSWVLKITSKVTIDREVNGRKAWNPRASSMKVSPTLVVRSLCQNDCNEGRSESWMTQIGPDIHSKYVLMI